VSTISVPSQPQRPGRPPCCSRELTVRIIQLHMQGFSYQAISDVLNGEGVPTPLGRLWWSKSSVDRLLHTRHAKDILAELNAASSRLVDDDPDGDTSWFT
jgi:hypothetical protein